MHIAVIGAGNYGTALAKVLAEQPSHDVCIWNWEGDPVPLNAIESQHENTAYLPGVALPASLRVERDLGAAVTHAELVLLTVPSHVCMAIAKELIPYFDASKTVVVASKGFCKETLLPLGLAFRAVLPSALQDTITVISGPAVAKELAAGVHTCMQIAGYSDQHTTRVLNAFQHSPIYLCQHQDIVGLSIGGSFKNVYAIALGMCDGLGMSLNTKSALLVFAMEELRHVSRALGGDEHTVYGLSGLGDMIGTGLNTDSRNRRFGEYIVKDGDIDVARKKVGQVVEGLDAIEILLALEAAHHTSFPFVRVIRAMLDDPTTARDQIISFIDTCTID